MTSHFADSTLLITGPPKNLRLGADWEQDAAPIPQETEDGVLDTPVRLCLFKKEQKNRER